MNDFRERLNDLARQNTSQLSLRDPSLEVVAAPPRRRRQLLIAVAAVVAVAATLFFWQGTNDLATSVVAGQDDGEPEPGGAVAAPAECDLGAIVPVLRAGLTTYDYQPAGSFGALYDDARAVVTGDVVSAARVEVNGSSYVELTLAEVTDLVTVEPRPDVDVIAYQSLWADDSSPDPLADPLVVEGLTVVGFVSPWSGIRGGWAPGPEGLYIGCGPDSAHVAVIESAAGPADPAEPTVAELQEAIPAYAAHLRDQLEGRDAAATAQAAEAARGAAERLVEARALWEATGPVDYRLYYYVEPVPQGSASGVRVDIIGGRVVGVDPDSSDDEVSGRVWTVDDLFDAIESADNVPEVWFDPTLGYPLELSLDPDDAVLGDEFSVRSIELVSVAEAAALNARVDAWLASIGPAIEPPESIALPSRRPYEEDPEEVRVLLTQPELDAFVYRTSDEVCIALGRNDVASGELDAVAGTCMGTRRFATSSIWLTSTQANRPGYTLVVPALDAFGAGWTASAEVGRLVVTDHAALVIVEADDAPPGSQVTLEIECECGDESHVLRQDAAGLDAQDAAAAAREAAAEDALAAAEEAALVEEGRLEALGFAPPETLADARALWDAVRIDDYRLGYGEYRPQGISTPVLVSVEGGSIVDVQFADGFGETERPWTVDDMFDLADTAATVRELEFDRTYGYPTLLRIDPDNNISGDELTLRQVEMTPRTTLDLADARVDAWLAAGPPPMPPLGAVAALLRSMNAGEVSEVYLLHEEPELDAFVYRTSDRVCAVVALKSMDDPNPEYTGESAGSCVKPGGFVGRPLGLVDRRPSGASYILVLPALDDFGTDWTASAEVGRLEVTDYSALLVVEEDDVPEPGPFPITVEVAGETHTLPWN